MHEFDKAFLQQAENDVKNLYNLYTNDRQETLKKVSIDEIATTVESLKNGKSPDERHISAEHLKYGGRKLLDKGVQVAKQSSVPNQIKGFTSIHKCHV
jgi:hypothetical protein